ncbi:hypothetical protein BpHYR1_016955 [Brachionus plicatilis]|uniref:Uncharacterized protein n=1 Tax=Brachionus plicatilis TaxID=10195 RepID=A0A3M7SSG4_BRAPC|nr:hypothetical protein BpHYR1_016955 [Brachionus plicatilis]
MNLYITLDLTPDGNHYGLLRIEVFSTEFITTNFYRFQFSKLISFKLNSNEGQDKLSIGTGSSPYTNFSHHDHLTLCKLKYSIEEQLEGLLDDFEYFLKN